MEDEERDKTERANLQKFIEDSPLYSRTNGAGYPNRPKKLRCQCSTCGEETNWLPCDVTVRAPGPRIAKDDDIGVEWGENSGKIWSYVCVQCGETYRTMWVQIVPNGGEFNIRKVGQEPPWDTRIAGAIESHLDEEGRELYRKALLNMSQGFGIGALAYFRRLVEDEVDALLEVVEETAKLYGDTEALKAIAKARLERPAERRLELAVEATPALLRAGGFNPMKILYDRYSRGLHAKGEAECLKLASDLRMAFDHVFKTIRESNRARVEVQKTLQRAASESGSED